MTHIYSYDGQISLNGLDINPWVFTTFYNILQPPPFSDGVFRRASAIDSARYRLDHPVAFCVSQLASVRKPFFVTSVNSFDFGSWEAGDIYVVRRKSTMSINELWLPTSPNVSLNGTFF